MSFKDDFVGFLVRKHTSVCQICAHFCSARLTKQNQDPMLCLQYGNRFVHVVGCHDDNLLNL